MIINPYNFAVAETPAPEDGLVAFYKGEGNADDASGNNRHGTLGSQTMFALGYDGEGQSFAFIDVQNNPNAPVTVPPLTEITGSYSIVFYVRSTVNQNYGHVISNDWTSAGNGALYLNQKNLEYWQGSTLRAKTTGEAADGGAWVKVKITFDGTKTRIYLNDVLNATESGTHTETGFFGTKLGFARVASDNRFEGRIDEVKFYNQIV